MTQSYADFAAQMTLVLGQPELTGAEVAASLGANVRFAPADVTAADTFDRVLDKPAELEVTCQLHPWSKAYILVFDHPYFATTSSTGAFSIDDIPPGTYHVRAWHPSLGLSDQTVTIVAGQPASLALKLSSAPASAPAAPAVAPAAAPATKS